MPSFAEKERWAKIRAEKRALQQQEADAATANAEASKISAMADLMKAAPTPPSIPDFGGLPSGGGGVPAGPSDAELGSSSEKMLSGTQPATQGMGFPQATKDAFSFMEQGAGMTPFGQQNSSSTIGSGASMGLGQLGIKKIEDGKGTAYSMAGGGEIVGPPGDDQVPAEMPDGDPARLQDGEVVLPAEYVHQLGVKAIRDAVEAVTGKPMDPAMKPPLPGQRGPVPSMANGAAELYRRRIQPKDTGESTIWNGQPLESTGGYPLVRQGTDQARMLAEQGMNNTLIQSPGAFRDSLILYKANGGKPVDTRQTGIPQMPSNVLPGSRERAAVQRGEAPVVGKAAPGGAGASEQARAVARAMTEQPRSEQALLDRLAPDGGSLTRQGRVFRREDPMSATGGGQPVEKPLYRVNSRGVSREVGPGGVRGQVADTRPVVGGWLAGPPRARAMMKETQAYDHLPISGVTYSDSIQGAGLGQRTPPREDAQTMEELRGLYSKRAEGQAAQKAALGVGGVRQAMLNRPAVTEAERASDVANMRAANAQEAQMAAARAALKPSDALAERRFQYDQGEDKRKATAKLAADQQKAVNDTIKDFGVPGAMPQHEYANVLGNLLARGVPLSEAVYAATSIASDERMVDAFRNYQKKGKKIYSEDMGGEVNPMDYFNFKLGEFLKQ